MEQIREEEIDKLFQRLDQEAENGGYHLNPDTADTKFLVKGLLVNEKRYGYWACPCRSATGDKREDLDIICPCDYRDPDVDEYDACYCGLYVSTEVKYGRKKIKPIPERRPAAEDRKNAEPGNPRPAYPELKYPVWRCKVCGYLCARDNPPESCPVCKAKRERFEIFMK